MTTINLPELPEIIKTLTDLEREDFEPAMRAYASLAVEQDRAGRAAVEADARKRFIDEAINAIANKVANAPDASALYKAGVLHAMNAVRALAPTAIDIASQGEPK